MTVIYTCHFYHLLTLSCTPFRPLWHGTELPAPCSLFLYHTPGSCRNSVPALAPGHATMMWLSPPGVPIPVPPVHRTDRSTTGTVLGREVLQWTTQTRPCPWGPALVRATRNCFLWITAQSRLSSPICLFCLLREKIISGPSKKFISSSAFSRMTFAVV